MGAAGGITRPDTARSTRPRWTKPRTGGPSAPRPDHHRRGGAGVERPASSRCTSAGRRTPEPQMRGGTVDAVDDYLPLVGARSSTAVGGTLRMAATSWPLTRPSSRATPVCGSREDRRRLPRSVDVQPGEQAPTKATGTMNSRAPVCGTLDRVTPTAGAVRNEEPQGTLGLGQPSTDHRSQHDNPHPARLSTALAGEVFSCQLVHSGLYLP